MIEDSVSCKQHRNWHISVQVATHMHNKMSTKVVNVAVVTVKKNRYREYNSRKMNDFAERKV